MVMGILVGDILYTQGEGEGGGGGGRKYICSNDWKKPVQLARKNQNQMSFIRMKNDGCFVVKLTSFSLSVSLSST